MSSLALGFDDDPWFGVEEGPAFGVRVRLSDGFGTSESSIILATLARISSGMEEGGITEGSAAGALAAAAADDDEDATGGG